MGWFSIQMTREMHKTTVMISSTLDSCSWSMMDDDVVDDDDDDVDVDDVDDEDDEVDEVVEGLVVEDVAVVVDDVVLSIILFFKLLVAASFKTVGNCIWAQKIISNAGWIIDKAILIILVWVTSSTLWCREICMNSDMMIGWMYMITCILKGMSIV